MNNIDYNIIPDELSEQEMELLSSLASVKLFSDQETIFMQDSPASSMFIIAIGKVAVVQNSGGVARYLASLNAGEFLGEMALLGHSRRNATAVADGTVVLWEISQEIFSSLLENDKLLADKLLKTRARREHEQPPS